jgi:hypothetical protein
MEKVSNHAQLLAAELQRLGLPKREAATLSSEVVLRHPIVQQLGTEKLAQRLESQGLPSDEATHLVLALWGLERLQQGACFQDLREGLSRAGVPDAEALAASLEARRLLRDTAASVPDSDGDRHQLARWCLLLMAALLLAGATLQSGV